MKNLRRLIGLLWTYPARSLGGLVAIILADMIQLTIPQLTKLIIDALEEQTMTSRELILWGVTILILAIVSYLAKQVWRHLILGAARRIEAQLRRRLLDKTLALTMKKAKETDTGTFMALASNDIPAVGQALAFGLVAFFDSVFITVVAFTFMYGLSPTLTGYSILPFPILTILMLLSLKIIYNRWDKTQQSLEELTEKTRESLSGIRTLRAYVQAKGDLDAFETMNLDYRRSVLHYVKIDALFSPLILLFAGSSSAILLYFGGQLVIDGSITVGTLAAFVGYLGLLTWPMIAAGWMFVLIQRGSASIARLDRILNAESEPDERPALAKATHLSVQNLSYSYRDGSPVLKGWDLTVEPGQTIGIVGPVGSGKSTFLKLLQRLEEPPKQMIFLDGHDIAEHSPSSVRTMFSYVSQEPFLFSDTIENNLLTGNPDATEKELHQAVELASLKQDIAEFPDGLKTMLGERGVSLSGGQKQRTALARALLKGAPFLLLDDTLSAVDTVTERQIIEHLRQEQQKRGQSVIIVTHRLSAVVEADEILVVDEGSIIDRGTHDELRQRPGLYRELLAHQSSDQEEPN